jgi:YD repeat-containing protein
VESVSSQLPGGKTINTSYTYTSYPPFHLPVTETINGITTTYNYNGVGDVESTVAPTGTTKMSYNSMGDVTSITDAFGRTTGYGYDSVGNLESVTDHFGRKSTVKYDSLGRPIQADSPLSSVTKNYPPPSKTSYEEQLTSKVGDITTSVRSVSTFNQDGRRVSDQVNMDVGADRFLIQKTYQPELGFDVSGSVTVTTPMIAGAKVKDDSGDFARQAGPVPAK